MPAMRSSRLLTLGVALAGALCWLGAATRAHAQAQELPRQRSGYYLAFGLMGGVSQAWRDGEAVKELGAGSGFGHRFGQMLTRHLGLGLRLDAGGARAGDDRVTLGGLALEGQWEFATNLTLRCGVGPALVAIEDVRDEYEPQKGTFGAGYSLGLSWDWFPWGSKASSGGFAFTPVMSTRFVPGRNASALTFLVGVEFTWWTGLPRDQLILPEDKAYRPR
jgi:hypothetical protein